MATFIHGIGASENIDSSGEIVSIAGLDISSLDKDGVFNYEHKGDIPAQVVGKILRAKKIFSDADCEDDHQLAFWNKVKVPYLYVMGELFDDYSDSAREVAGRFRYDADKKGQNERAVMNFSVEGSKISKEGITVARSIARKITITVLPCNKAAVAEMVAVAASNPKKSAIDELFKTEAVEIEILQFNKNDKMWDLLKKEDPNKHAAKLGLKPFKKDMGGGQMTAGASTALSGVGPTSAGGLMASEDMKKAGPPKLSIAKPAPAAAATPAAQPQAHARGNQIGITSGGHGVYSHGMVGDYSHYSHKDHAEAAEAHSRVAQASKDPKAQLHHSNKARLHTARSNNLEVQGRMRAERREGLKPNRPSSGAPVMGTDKKLFHPERSGTITPPGPVKKSEMNKAMDAGSALAAPGNLVQGAALAKEKIKKSAASTTMVNKQHEADELEKGSADPKLAPKDRKVKELQQKIDSGTYKQPDASKIADKIINHPEKPLKKSAWLQRAEAEYASWNKREAFEQFMQKRMPHLTKAEIQVIGQTMLLQKSIKQEKMLKDFYAPGALRKEKK